MHVASYMSRKINMKIDSLKTMIYDSYDSIQNRVELFFGITKTNVYI